MNGPNGFWCRYCGKYQSLRNSAELKAMRAHLAAHKDAGDDYAPVVNGFPTLRREVTAR